jgi:hypothetical protein
MLVTPGFMSMTRHAPKRAASSSLWQASQPRSSLEPAALDNAMPFIVEVKCQPPYCPKGCPKNLSFGGDREGRVRSCGPSSRENVPHRTGMCFIDKRVYVRQRFRLSGVRLFLPQRNTSSQSSKDGLCHHRHGETRYWQLYWLRTFRRLHDIHPDMPA